jgi:hypothetical protein
VGHEEHAPPFLDIIRGYRMKQMAGIAFIFLLLSFASADVQRFNIPIGDSPQKGPKDAPVTIIEFLDFQ